MIFSFIKKVLFKKHKEKNVRDNWKCYYGFRNELVIYKQENIDYAGL